MIGYVTIGTNDLARAVAFYDVLAAELGTPRMFETPRSVAWGAPGGAAGIGVTLPFDGQPASVGNGMMVALAAADPDQVHRLHALALANGGTCEGAPGARGEGGFHAAYFRDPDGNKLCAFTMVAP